MLKSEVYKAVEEQLAARRKCVAQWDQAMNVWTQHGEPQQMPTSYFSSSMEGIRRKRYEWMTTYNRLSRPWITLACMDFPLLSFRARSLCAKLLLLSLHGQLLQSCLLPEMLRLGTFTRPIISACNGRCMLSQASCLLLCLCQRKLLEPELRDTKLRLGERLRLQERWVKGSWRDRNVRRRSGRAAAGRPNGG